MRSSAAEYLTFVAASGTGGVEAIYADENVWLSHRITAADAKTYDTKHYNLSAIIAVGYKVNSERAVQFRKSRPSCWEDAELAREAVEGEGRPTSSAPTAELTAGAASGSLRALPPW